MLQQADGLLRTGGLAHPPTFFEAATAIALSWFRRAAVDVAVVEVGLGGRLDATNVLTPAAGVITSIGLDHREHLGDTLEAVAAEKAGIVKPGMVVVTTETAPPAVAVIDDACRRRGARLVRAGEDTAIAVRREGPRPRIEVTTPPAPLPPRSLWASPARISDRTRRAPSACSKRWPAPGCRSRPRPSSAASRRWHGRGASTSSACRGAGRSCSTPPTTPPAAAALARHLREAFPGRLPIVCAVMRDKDADGIIDRLAPCASRIVCTAPRNPRATPAGALADRVRARAPELPVTAADDPRRALETAWGTSETVCATGSIFLVGELLAELRRRREP